MVKDSGREWIAWWKPWVPVLIQTDPWGHGGCVCERCLRRLHLRTTLGDDQSSNVQFLAFVVRHQPDPLDQQTLDHQIEVGAAGARRKLGKNIVPRIQHRRRSGKLMRVQSPGY